VVFKVIIKLILGASPEKNMSIFVEETRRFYINRRSEKLCMQRK